MTAYSNLKTIPGALETLIKAGSTSWKKPGTVLPDAGFSIDRVQTDPKQYAAFCKMFGYSGEKVPSTYWHIRLFSIRALLGAHPQAPFPMPGMVHLTDEIQQMDVIHPNDNLRMECKFGQLLHHDKGTAFETLTTLYKGSRPVWRENAVNLYFGKKGLGQKDVFNPSIEVPEPKDPQNWELGTMLGIEYAQISGDYNPIHLHTLTAKAMGFPRHLIHGWYSVNRTLARRQERITQPHELFVAFKKPLFIPGKVTSNIHDGEKSITFEVVDTKEGFPHLKGYLKY